MNAELAGLVTDAERSFVRPTAKEQHVSISSRTLNALCCATVVLACGCAAADPSHEETGLTKQAASPGEVEVEGEGMTLLARIDVGPRAVRFYETEPGMILTLESGLGGSKRLLDDRTSRMRPSQQYELLAGQRAPQALLDAEARVPVPPSEDEPLVLDDVPDQEPIQLDAPAGLTDKADGWVSPWTAEEWPNVYCTGVLDHERCHRWVTGTISHQFNDIQYFGVGARAIYGRIRMRARTRTWFNWGSYSTYYIDGGEEAIIYWSSNNLDFDGHAIFDEAAAGLDQYHGLVKAENGFWTGF